MRRNLTVGAAVIALSLPATGAFAVDVTNQDNETYRLTVSENGEESLIDIAPRTTLKGICDACSLSLGDDERHDAAGDEVAMIRGGKLLIQ